MNRVSENSTFDGNSKEDWITLHAKTHNERISLQDAPEDAEHFAREALNTSQDDDSFKGLEASLEELEERTLQDQTSG